jgi:dihydrofolate reductase
MSKVVVLENVTLDGVMQAPGRPDEDTRDGFEHGGWAAPYQAMGSLMAEGAPQTEALLFGRRTYEDFASFWPTQGDNPYNEVLTGTPKYVASTTMREPLPWENSTLLKGDAGDEVARLKEGTGGDLLIMGSGQLVQSLMRRNLLDEFTLLIHPLVLGTGRRLFPDGGAPATLRLTESRTTPTGVVIGFYRVG